MIGIYCMAKAGVISLTKSTALEYGAEGIRCNAICPGPILTEMWGPNPDPDRIAMRAKSIPMARLGMPEEVAEVAAFLASDRSSFVNGAVIPVDGGNMTQVPS
jgi:NAD(P)-dependent dehydrogenase (short-subunit alcohol dehydrogenase family)